jgi:hypothetical protein
MWLSAVDGNTVVGSMTQSVPCCDYSSSELLTSAVSAISEDLQSVDLAAAVPRPALATAGEDTIAALVTGPQSLLSRLSRHLQ